jgi:hypothetical protein
VGGGWGGVSPAPPTPPPPNPQSPIPNPHFILFKYLKINYFNYIIYSKIIEDFLEKIININMYK